MRSGNRPSPAKLLGVLSGKTKFKDSKVGKAINPEGKKVSITIGDKKFGDTKVGKFLKGFGPRSKAAKPAAKPMTNTPKTGMMHPSDAIGLSKPKPKASKSSKPSKPSKPKTTYGKAFSNMERVTGKTRGSYYRKNPHTGELYADSAKGLQTFTDQAKAYNKKQGK